MSTNRSPDASPLTRLSTLLTRLPGIGEKSALRLALWLARADAEYVGALAQALRDVHETMRLCSVCCDLCAGELCERCADARRDHSLVCVVAHPQDRMPKGWPLEADRLAVHSPLLESLRQLAGYYGRHSVLDYVPLIK